MNEIRQGDYIWIQDTSFPRLVLDISRTHVLSVYIDGSGLRKTLLSQVIRPASKTEIICELRSMLDLVKRYA